MESPYFKVVNDPEHLKKIGFPTGEAQCFALGAKLEVSDVHIMTGGGATNAAVTFARQGLKAACLMTMGEDQEAEQVISELKKEKIVSIPTYTKKLKTSYSVVLLSPGGERTILNYRGASGLMKAKDIPFNKIKTKAVYITPGVIAVDTIRKIVKHFHAEGALIAINPSSQYLDMGKKLYPLLKEIDVIIMNREEAAQLTGVPYDDEKKIFARFDQLVPGLAVMTEGSKGVMVSDGKRVFQAGIYKEREIIDRTGAGDAFGSGFVATLLRRGVSRKSIKIVKEEVIEEAICSASANATSVVERMGAKPGILDKKDLVSFLRKKPTLDIRKI
jgi:sugar/nucleoside kinase (ribokinase family)